MAKKVVAIIKLHCPAGQANPAPPVGPALGQHGVNIMEFCKTFNARTQDQAGLIIPAVISVYADRSFTFELKSPPAAVLLKKAAKIKKGSDEPHKTKVGTVSQKDLEGYRRDQEGRSQCLGHGSGQEDYCRDRTVHGSESGGLREVARRSKRYQKAAELIDSDKLYTLEEAIGLIKSFPDTSLDESVDLAINLAVDPKHADQMVRGAIVLPHGIGKTVRVLVFAKGDKEQEARDAGADFVGGDDLAKKIQEEGWMDFDRVIASPDMMGVVGRLGKVLGPRGLMPNPKLGTVTPNVAQAVSEQKAGKVEYRVDKSGIIHCSIGKRSLGSTSHLGERLRTHPDGSESQASRYQGHLYEEDYGFHDNGSGAQGRSFGSPRRECRLI